ncbi:DUF805 domain-containing protein [Streptococcus hillyeri]|uniref:DUF805 domain-containing protein n=1 Tax=Streptococcus hillyeri TaxID=2282420 RepID=A0A3L9DXZ8_9STRE|nr:DUF805 domain-containing protein [Streptococcus hillyeri]RLY05158.1 DUF805 domain-containing protein [Streptococcus hillyeri]
MFQAYKKYWLNYANFEGKSSRADFWWVVLCNTLISLPFYLIGFFLFFFNMLSVIASDPVTYEYMSDEEAAAFVLEMFGSTLPIVVVFVIWGLAILIPNLALEVRRYRDAGLSWAFIFLNLGAFAFVVPFFGWLISLGCQIARLVLLVQPSKADFGNSSPKEDAFQTENSKDASLSNVFED